MLENLQVSEKDIGIQFAHRGPIINHLMYADDNILFFKAAQESFDAITFLLQLYGSLAGQKINYSKSELVFSPNTPRDFKDGVSTSLGVRHSIRLGKYLGMKIDSHQNKKEVLQDMVEKFR